VHNNLNFCLSFKMRMKVVAGAEIRGSEVLKNRGVIQKRHDLETFISFANMKMEIGDSCYLVPVVKLKGYSLLLHFRYLYLFHMSLNFYF